MNPNNLAHDSSNGKTPMIFGVSGELTMSSLDFLNNIINPSRESAGEKPVRPADFHARVNDEIGENLNYENFVVGKTGHKTYYTNLNMEQMTLVGMRESKAVRKAVLEKLKSLSKPVFDPRSVLEDAELLRSALLSYTGEVIELKAQVKEMKPDVEAFERLSKASGGMCITDAAKTLQMRPTDLFSFLSASKWIYKRVGNKNWLAYQDKIQRGLLVHKTKSIPLEDGSEKIVESVIVTPKGLAVIAQLLQAQGGVQ